MKLINQQCCTNIITFEARIDLTRMMQVFRFLISKTFLINLLIALVLISSALYATLSYLDGYTLHGTTIEVPQLTDYYIDEVDTIVAKDNFEAVIADSIFMKGKKAGLILEQNPKAGTTVKQGRKIYLTVAAREAVKVSMPDLIDLSFRQAKSLLETYGLELGELIYKADLCTNCILEQHVGGNKIKPGVKIQRGTSVDLIVGQGLGDELAAVPYLIDFTAELANDLLKTRGLNIGGLLFDETVETAEDSLAARVYKQTPFYSEAPSVRMGSSVDLFLTLDTNRIVHTVNPKDSL